MEGHTANWRNCDACGAKMPVHDLVRTWCDACGWNVSDPSDPRRNLLDRKIEALGQLHGTWLLNNVIAAPEAELRPRLSAPTLLAFAISVAVSAVSLLVGCAGLYLLISGWPNIMFIIGGIVLLVIAWFLRPRLGSVPKDCLTRSEFPALFGMVDDIAARLVIKPIDHVRVDEEFNASMAEIGLARRPVLTIGLPMWVSLTGQERAALIGHELAHRANHDPARGMIIGSGLSALYGWGYLLDPSDQRAQSFSESLVHVLMRVLGAMVGGLCILLTSLLFLDSQRAEYLADYLGAKIAGPEASVSLLRKIGLAANLRAVAERVYYAGDTDGRSVIDAFRAFVKSAPERELERIKRSGEKENARIDSSHPPTVSRIKFIEGRRFEVPLFALSDAQSLAIDHELQPLYAKLSMKLMDRYFD